MYLKSVQTYICSYRRRSSAKRSNDYRLSVALCTVHLMLPVPVTVYKRPRVATPYVACKSRGDTLPRPNRLHRPLT